MKKLLALVLALVMTLGLATVGSNAALSDLKDADKIKGGDFEEAITVVEAVGVMVGDNNNNFEPTKALTRAEGAMIAARLIATNKVAASLTGNGKKFSDVPANFWNGNGSGVIEYCAANGILNGVGNGKFDPNGALSTVAFAKMMLTSLGYDSNVEGYVNNVDWQTNVMTRAQRIGLMKGLDNVMANDQLTREQAAQMVFNALKTPIVEYDAKIAVSVNGADVSVGNTNAKPVTNEERAKQTIYSNRVNAQQAGTNGAFVVEFAEQYYPGLVLTADTDVFGRPASTWTYGRNELGTWANGDLFVKDWTEEVDGDTVYNTMGALAYKNYPKEVWVDGVELTGTAKTAIVDEIKKDGDTLGETGQGVLTELYVYDGATDATSYARLVIINTYLAKALTSYASKNVSLGVYDNSGWDAQVAYTASETYVDDDLTGIKADDYVLVTMTDPRTDKAVIRSVKPAETMENTYVSAYTANKTGTKMTSITVDGTKINVADKAKWKHEILSNFSLETLKGFTYNVYLDIYGNVIGIDYHTLDTNFVFVVGTDTKGSNIYNTTYTAKMIFLDGTSSDQIVTLAKTASDNARAVLTDDGTNQNKGNAHVNAWFAFSKADDGAIILRDLVPFTGDKYKQFASEVAPTANIEIDSAHTTLPTNAAGTTFAYGNDDSVYISVETDNSASIANGNGVIKGVTGMSKGIKNTSLNSESTRGMANFNVSTTSRLTNGGAADNANAFYLYKGNYIVGAVVVGTNAGVAKNYIYVISGPSSRQYNGRYLDTYSVIVEGEKKTIEVDSQKTGTTDNKLASNRLHQVAYDKDDIVVEIKNPTTGLAKRLATTLNTNDNKTKGYVYTPTNNQVTVDGYTMTINAASNNACYVVVAEKSNATFWVQTPGTSTYTQYGDLKTAYGQATRKDAEKGTRKITSVSAVIDGATGFANEVIFTTSYTATGVAFGDDVVVINKAGVGIYDGVEFYTPDAHTITYAEARAALLDQIKSDLPNSDPVFVATNKVEFTMNGKTVSATIAAFAEQNATSILRAYQVYKVTYVNGTESTSAYVDRYAYDRDLAAALRAENSSTAYKANDNVTVSYVVPGDDPSDIVMINNARFDSKKAYLDGVWYGTADYARDLIVAGGDPTARLQAIINNSQSDVIVLDSTVNDKTEDLKIPEGKTLVLKGNENLTVKDLTVNGKIMAETAGANWTITAENVTIDGEEAEIWVPNGTLNPGTAEGKHNAILKDGATVIIFNVGTWDNVVINCTLQVNGDINATNVFLTGADEDGSVLELNSTTTQTIANVYFGYTLDKDNTPKKATPASATVLELPENKENAAPAKLTNVVVNGDTAMIVNDAVIGTLELNKSAKVALIAEKAYNSGNDGIEVQNLTVDGASEATFDTDKVVVAKVTDSRPKGETGKVTLPTGTTTDGTSALSDKAVAQATTVKATVTGVSASSSSSNVYFTNSDTITVSFDRTVTGATTSTPSWTVRTAGQNVIATYSGSDITSSGSVTIENVAPASVETGETAGKISVTVTISSDKSTSYTAK